MPTILVYPGGFGKKQLLDAESLIRLRKAFAVYQHLCSHNVSSSQIYFVSSVQDRLHEKGLSQSEAIKDTLIRWGVAPRQIVICNQASSTLDDIRYSYQLVERHHLPYPIINVSSWYHIPRIWLIWKMMRKRMGYPRLQYVFAGSSNHYFVLEEPKKIWKLLKRWKKRDIAIIKS